MLLTDAQWEKVAPFCHGKPTDPGRTGGGGRLCTEAVPWIARTGSTWRDLPTMFGKWNTVFKRFRDWVKADVFKRMIDAVSDKPDMEYAMVNATIVRVHRHGQGAKGGVSQKVNRMAPLDIDREVYKWRHLIENFFCKLK